MRLGWFAPQVKDPLLRSGLALAGAIRSSGQRSFSLVNGRAWTAKVAIEGFVKVRKTRSEKERQFYL
jgi:hypothetical protein